MSVEIGVGDVLKAFLYDQEYEESGGLASRALRVDDDEEEEKLRSNQKKVVVEIGRLLTSIGDQIDRENESALQGPSDVVEALIKKSPNEAVKSIFDQAAEKAVYLSSMEEGLARVGAVVYLAKKTGDLLRGENVSHYIPKVFTWAMDYVTNKLGTTFKKKENGTWIAQDPKKHF